MLNLLISSLVPRVGVEPTRCQATRDFKSLASTNSATQARCGNDPTYIRFAYSCQDEMDLFMLAGK
jgi:hypothetical protein